MSPGLSTPMMTLPSPLVSGSPGRIVPSPFFELLVGTPVSAGVVGALVLPALVPPPPAAGGAEVPATVAPLLAHPARSRDATPVATPSMRSRDDGFILLIGVPFGVDDAAPGRWQRWR